MASVLRLVTLRDPACTTVLLDGDLDLATAEQLDVLLTDLVAESPAELVIDMGGVGFVDASGLGVLVRAQRELAARRGALTLANPSPMMRRMIDLLELQESLPVAG